MSAYQASQSFKVLHVPYKRLVLRYVYRRKNDKWDTFPLGGTISVEEWSGSRIYSVWAAVTDTGATPE